MFKLFLIVVRTSLGSSGLELETTTTTSTTTVTTATISTIITHYFLKFFDCFSINWVLVDLLVITET